jgi:hypothetical protein
MSTTKQRSNEELEKILQGLQLQGDVAHLKLVKKQRPDAYDSLQEAAYMMAIKVTRSVPFKYVFCYDRKAGTVAPLRDSHAERLCYAGGEDADVDREMEGLLTAEQKEKLTRPERLYTLFKEGRLGCKLDSITNAHVSNAYLMEEKEGRCYPLSTKEGLARLPPLIVQRAPRTPSKLTLAKEAERILECRARIEALLRDDTVSHEKKSGKHGKKSSHSKKRHHKEESSESESESDSGSSSGSGSIISESSSEVEERKHKKRGKKEKRKRVVLVVSPDLVKEEPAKKKRKKEAPVPAPVAPTHKQPVADKPAARPAVVKEAPLPPPPPPIPKKTEVVESMSRTERMGELNAWYERVKEKRGLVEPK